MPPLHGMVLKPDAPLPPLHGMVLKPGAPLPPPHGMVLELYKHRMFTHLQSVHTCEDVSFVSKVFGRDPLGVGGSVHYTTCQLCNMSALQHGCLLCNMSAVQHVCCATCLLCNMSAVQHGCLLCNMSAVQQSFKITAIIWYMFSD